MPVFQLTTGNLQGIVRGRTFVDAAGAYVKTDEVDEKCLKAKDGRSVTVQWEKMSKSRGNGVEPLAMLAKDGVDLSRLQLLDSAAPRQPINWGESDLRGLRKWLDRVAWIVNAYVEGRQAKKSMKKDKAFEEAMRENYNYFVRNVSYLLRGILQTTILLDVLHIHNTAIARLQGMTNALRKVDAERLATSPQTERCLRALVTMMQALLLFHEQRLDLCSPHSARTVDSPTVSGGAEALGRKNGTRGAALAGCG